MIAYYNMSPLRALPWLIGMVFGYFLHVSNNKPNLIRKPIAQRVLFVALVICFAHVFGAAAVLNASYSKWINSIYLSLSPTAFVLSLAWIIYCCKLGYAGPINSFLSCPPFKIVSKLTHCIYLVQSLVIHYSIFSMRVPPFITGFEMTVHQIPGDLLYSFLIGLLLALSVELPTQTIVNVLLKKPSSAMKSCHVNKLTVLTFLPDRLCSVRGVQNVNRSIGINLLTEHIPAKRPKLETALLMVASTIYDLRNKFIET
ncbi:hypothetical protein PPYR_03120 [Photinus pyralis]|uniref:Uncharacterized protein n=1 Tax=Photinus pyralis TaxID=7054 RepID=A0A5N4A1W1_PHOPY|nr:hypothetical protein PPYR_03120 [Photinus pyralis]